jgi:hypothetical protein
MAEAEKGVQFVFKINFMFLPGTVVASALFLLGQNFSP